MDTGQKKVILVAPLDWGIGHASRCIPLIRYFCGQGHKVILASNGRSAAMLREEFPELEILTDIPDYTITYPENDNFSLHFAKHALRLLRVLRNEQSWINLMVDQHKIDLVVSDNRYGLYCNKITTYFITHQIFIPAPGVIRWLINAINHYYIRKFNHCFVPDFSGKKNLSGALSHGKGLPSNVRYIGPLSRFAGFNRIPDTNVEHIDLPNLAKGDHSFEFDICVIISGPEPARTLFSKTIKSLFADSNKKIIIIEGRTESPEKYTISNIQIASHLKESEFRSVVAKSKSIICRPGYSTLMDLFYLQREALLVPTPGQKEQEYLAQLCTSQNIHRTVEQKKLDRNFIDSWLNSSAQE